MKNIPNKVFATEPCLTTTATLLKESLVFMPNGGFDLVTLRARSRVMEAIEKMKDETIQLEDADFATAVQAVQTVKWVHLENYLITFSEQFGL